MKELKPRFRRVVLVCDTQRPDGAEKPSCGYHGASELRRFLKKRLKSEGLWGKDVRVLTTSCLDVCPNEGVICSFDNGETLHLVDAEADREAILQSIVDGA